jgi:hypothetical protein
MSFRTLIVTAAIAAILAPAALNAQESPAPGGQPALPKRTLLSIRSFPDHATLTLSGPAEATGQAPIEIPATYEGTFSVRVRGEGFARTHGRIYLSPSGGAPTLVSERPGASAGLLVRSLNFPGIPDLSAGHGGRGLLLMTGAVGAGIAATRAHVRLRHRLDEPGIYAAQRSADERVMRNDWIGYGLGLWGVSAVDYWIRPRFGLDEPSASGVTLLTPTVTRGGVIWRSLLVPGAGQEYANQGTRGLAWLGATLASGAAFVVAAGEVHRAETQVASAQIQVDSAGPSERALRIQEVQHQLDKLQSARDARHAFAVTTAALYAANFIDAVVVPIHKHAGQPAPARAPAKVSLVLPISPDSPRLALLARF